MKEYFKKEYFKEIEILEGVYFENKETLLQRDWSSFFEISLENEEFKIFLDKLFLKLNSKKNKEFEIFLDKLFLKLNSKFKSLHEYFDIENPKEEFLNKRVYKLKGKKKGEIKTFITNFYNNYLQENYIKDENKFYINSIDDNDFTIKKLFNPETFFSDHESLLDKKCDFLREKRVYLGIKDKEKKELNSLEDQIKNTDEKNKFYVKVDLSDLKIENCIFEGNQKYENIFILERGDYIYHTNKK